MKRTILFFILLGLTNANSFAQCAMCRAVLESEQGQATAKGINDGIIYLMAIPYILVGGISYIIYLKFYKAKKSS